MSHSDAIVFFGAIGDLAYKQIFPALQALVKRHTLDIPIIGVAKAGWTLDQLRVRARQSVAQLRLASSLGPFRRFNLAHPKLLILR